MSTKDHICVDCPICLEEALYTFDEIGERWDCQKCGRTVAARSRRGSLNYLKFLGLHDRCVKWFETIKRELTPRQINELFGSGDLWDNVVKYQCGYNDVTIAEYNEWYDFVHPMISNRDLK
jgi:hypothetical protein